MLKLEDDRAATEERLSKLLSWGKGVECRLGINS